MTDRRPQITDSLFRAFADNLAEEPAVLLTRAGDGELARGLFDICVSEGQTPVSITLTDSEDRGAAALLSVWRDIEADGVDVRPSFGDELALEVPVQQNLFVATPDGVAPPSGLVAAPFDALVRLETVDPADEPRWIERMLRWTSVGGLLLVRLHNDLFGREFGRTAVERLGSTVAVLAVEKDGPATWFLLRVERPGRGDGELALRAPDLDQAQTIAKIQSASSDTLADVTAYIGATATLGFDDVWALRSDTSASVPKMPVVRGGDVRAWRVDWGDPVVWPYDSRGERAAPPDERLILHLARHRSLLEQRKVFGEDLEDRDVRWYEYSEFFAERWSHAPIVVVPRRFRRGRVAVVESPAVVVRSAIAFAPLSSADPHFLAGVLASTSVWRWMQARFVGADGGPIQLTAAGLAELPLPPHSDEIAELARAASRRSRSHKPLVTAIDGDPGRLRERLQATKDANDRVVNEVRRLMSELDRAVAAAYGHKPTDFDVTDEEPSPDVQAVLKDWLASRIDDAFRIGALPTDRAVSALRVGAWADSDPLLREVVSMLEGGIVEVLLDASVALESAHVFSESGARKLHRWAQGQVAPFNLSDYAARDLPIPPTSARDHQARNWRMRGRFNVASERFLLLVERSASGGEPLFAWANVSEKVRRSLARLADEQLGRQVDLDVLMRIRAVLDENYRPIREIVAILEGPSVEPSVAELALRALLQSGDVEELTGCYRASS